MHMYKFALGIVLYNPTKASINRIVNFAKIGVDIYIYDNSKSSVEELNCYPNIDYTFNYNNNGLSYGIDFLCKQAKIDKHNYLLFFDQDTVFKIETLNFIDDFINYIEANNNYFFDSAISINFREKSIEKNKLNVISKNIIDDYELLTIYFNINSGTLFMLNKYSFFTWFDKKYFVDGVDYSFSLNVLINNYKNLSIANVPGLNHTEEQGDTTINFLGKKLISRVYPLNRNIDFLKSHIRLFIKSFKIKPLKPKLFILKAISSYIVVQLIFRMKNILN